jgi:uncharacterized membrane protein
LLYDYFKYPEYLLLIIPIFIILVLLIKKDFVVFKDEDIKSKKLAKILILLSRTIIYFLLLIAIASPFMFQEKIVQGEAFVKILADNSTSFNVFDSNAAAQLKNNLEKEIDVEMKSIGQEEISDLGDGILKNLKNGDNILLVTDGNNNVGTELGDIALYATRLNATISAINLDPIKEDIGIVITGPGKTVADIDNVFTVIVNKVGNADSYHIKIEVDDEVIIDKTSTEYEHSFVKQFSGGYHKIKAEVTVNNDYFSDNNIFYKTIKVVPKPKILYFSKKDTPMIQLLEQLYDVTETDSLEGDFSEFTAIVVDDISALDMNHYISSLTDFVANGDGLFSIGGTSSYERGGYKGSQFETMLPVFVGAAEKKEGNVNVVIVIDISGSTGYVLEEGKTVDVEKAIVLNMITGLSLYNYLGVVAFNTQAYLVSPMSQLADKGFELEDKISKLLDSDRTAIEVGLNKAIEMLRPLEGSKNIILVSDGRNTQGSYYPRRAAELANSEGMKVYTIGIGFGTNEHLMEGLAELGHGIYFPVEEAEKINIIFGDVEETETRGDNFPVVVLNSNHFITKELDINATIIGYNQVIPKSTGRLLVTTETGQPVLTIWRFGLGRTASLSTDGGSSWAGQLLSKQNSKLITRAMNWVIGDPDRKNKNYVDIKDTTINRKTELKIRSETRPSAEDIIFSKIGEDLYSGEITPKKEGFHSVLDALFAVNYNVEYQNLGFNHELDSIVQSTGGEIFERNDIDGIISSVQSRARRTVIEKDNLRWPFVLAALILFLIEVGMRRILLYRYKHK